MKKEFKVGDRIVFYSGDRKIGIITSVVDTEKVQIETTPFTGIYAAYVKQLRHLLPKKRREIFLLEYNGGTLGVSAFSSIDTALHMLDCTSSTGRVVRFVEAKESKK